MVQETIDVNGNIVPDGDGYNVERIGGSIRITLETGETTMLVPGEVKHIVKERAR